MADLKIKIEGTKFVDVNCENGSVENFDPYHVVANGWDCYIYQNGKIYCEAKETYEDGLHFIKYIISPDGSFELKLRKPTQTIAETLQKGKPLSRGKRIFIKSICLTDGYIDNRSAYFEKED